MTVALSTSGSLCFSNLSNGGIAYLSATGTTPFTVQTGDTALLVIVAANMNGSGNTAVVSAQWNSTGASPQNLTLIADSSEASTGRIAMFGLVNPSTGALNCFMQFTGSSIDYLMVPMSFTGTSTDTVANVFKNATVSGATSQLPQVTITSESGSIVVGGYTNHNSPFQGFNSVDNTAVGGGTQNGGNSINIAANRANGGSPNITLGASLAASGSWSAVGVDVATPASTAGSTVSILEMSIPSLYLSRRITSVAY